MVKLIAMYKKPQDAARFNDIYFNPHAPLAAKMPGLRRTEISRVTETLRGGDEYYLIASLYFDDADSLNKSMASDESRAAARTLRDIGAEVVMLTADVEDV